MAMRILDVGQCGFDGPEIGGLFHKRLGAKVDSAATADDARKKLADKTYDLVLVNRVFAADGSSGLDLIEELVRDASPAPVMLVSDRKDAQATAVAKGAVPGFGKAALDDADTFELIKNAANADSR
jgi:DNA-binding NarL/FixJ family response regulator